MRAVSAEPAKAHAEGAFLPFDEADVVAWENAVDVSEKTKRNYRLGLASFCEYARACGFSAADIDEDAFVGFKEWCVERGLSPSGVSLYLSSVRSFYKHLEAAGVRNPARNVRGARAPRGFKKEALSLSQARELLACIAGDDEASLRDKALISLMLHTGIRDIEVVRADVGDMGSSSGYDVLRVHGKGRDEADEVVKLSPTVVASIRRYLAVRESAAPHDPLFASVSNRNKGGRLTTRSVSGSVKGALKRIGVDDPRYTALSLRHTAITLALVGGATDMEAKEMARHADISTTMIYSHHIDRLANAAEDRVSELLDG